MCDCDCTCVFVIVQVFVDWVCLKFLLPGLVYKLKVLAGDRCGSVVPRICHT